MPFSPRVRLQVHTNGVSAEGSREPLSRRVSHLSYCRRRRLRSSGVSFQWKETLYLIPDLWNALVWIGKPLPTRVALVHKSRQGQRGACGISLLNWLRDRSPELGHAVHHRTGHPRFRFLRRERASTQGGSDQGFVAKHRGFDQRTFSVAHRLLSAATALLLDCLNMLVA